MKVVYDREEDILTIEVLPEAPIAHAEHLGPPSLSILILRIGWCC
ncbi:MAG: hypothetical protein KatS3mg131_1190 [Candidatus Tectimicrobiota bacterium]|nr:MAG: hypothetical protein KatS3mg131_1190 [Candidatus Tectomicrobia bacterium]